MENKFTKPLITFLVVGIVTAFFLIGTESPKKVGLYQYIRKAHKYVEEGKYKKAIFFLHKAYEISPDSKKIEDNLLYGYLEYANFLDKTNDLDGAIDYLSMALEISPANPSVSHNLAKLYCKKAIIASESKQYDRALDYLQQATDLAIVSGKKKVKRSIANFLYNSAVTAYNKNDAQTVVLCLNTSYALKTRSSTLNFLAQHYYRESDLKKALFYWEKALSMRPTNAETKKNVSKIKKEILLQQNMRKIETQHFDVQLHSSYAVNLELLTDTLGKIYNETGEDLNYFPSLSLPLIFYSEEDFRKIFRQQGIIRAFYDGTIRMIFNPDVDEITFSGIIAHEYTHALISMITDNKCPSWLHEGVAVYEQARYLPVSLAHIAPVIEAGKKLTLGQLEDGFLYSTDNNTIATSYEGAFTAVSFILDKWGWSGLKGLLKRLHNGRHFANAIDEEFYISLNAFENMWNEYLREKFKERSTSL